MANKYTATPIPQKRKLEKLYKSGMTQAQVGKVFGVTQKVVYSWFKKLGIKSRIPRNTNQEKEKNYSWKGDKAGYAALHYRVQKTRGKPNYCVRCDKSGKGRYEWAILMGDYTNPYDYIRLCKRCHLMFDRYISNLKK